MSKKEDTGMDNTRGVSTSSSMEFVREEEISPFSERERDERLLGTIERNEHRSATLVMISGLRVKGARPKLMPELIKSPCQIKKVTMFSKLENKNIFLSNDRLKGKIKYKMWCLFLNPEKEEVSLVKGKQLNDRTQVTRHIIPYDQRTCITPTSCSSSF